MFMVLVRVRVRVRVRVKEEREGCFRLMHAQASAPCKTVVLTD